MKALIVANTRLERELELARVAVSSGFSRQWPAKAELERAMSKIEKLSPNGPT